MMLSLPGLHRTRRQVYSKYGFGLSLSYVSVSFSQLRNIAAPFLERPAILRITLILALKQLCKPFLLLSTVFYLPPPSDIKKGQRKGGGRGGG